MNFFPTPYPDEILYSVLARYSIRSGNINEIHNFYDIFSSKNCIATLELPTNLKALVSNMPLNSTYTEEYFIKNNTLFPYLAAFVESSREEEIKNLMKVGNGSIPYIKLGLLSYNIYLNENFRFCPQCFKEDIDIYGEPYWHRTHQITGLFICPKHKSAIYNSKELIRAGNRQRFIKPSKYNCLVENKIYYSDEIMEKMIWIAEDVEKILTIDLPSKDANWFVYKYRAKLIEKGYAKMNNFVYQKKLRKDFIDFYSEEYLSLLQSSLTNSDRNWLSNMVRNNNKTTYVLRNLLLARFLDIPIDTLFKEKLEVDGDNEDDKVERIESYNNLWNERLLELVQLQLSIREIASILGSSTKTIRKAIDELGIEKFWKYNGGGKYTKVSYVETEEFRIKRDNIRRLWRELLDKYPDKSSNQLRQYNQATYRWLTKYDVDWLRKNTRQSNRRENYVNWIQRDEELVIKAKDVVKEMREGKPQRITWSTVGSRLGVSGWMSKGKEKLPLTKQYMETVEESLKEFQIRKINWALERLENENKTLTYWNLVEISGVKPKYMKNIKQEVKSILIDNGYECDFL